MTTLLQTQHSGARATHTSLPWLWTDKTRTERKCSRQRSSHGSVRVMMSLQLCVPRLCKSVSENLGCIPEQQPNSFCYCLVFIAKAAVNMASARLFSFSCFCFPKEEASCGSCFFSAFSTVLEPPLAYLKEFTSFGGQCQVMTNGRETWLDGIHIVSCKVC